MRIALCGGTFDPFHCGHIEPVLNVREAMRWDRVIYIPAWRQPFKSERITASGHHRFAMAAIATREHDDVYVDPLELERGGTSYTVDTLRELHRRFPRGQFDWIIGDDNVADFDRWKEPDELLRLARFVVLNRTGAGDDPRFTYAKNAAVPVSSTEIRQRVRDGAPIDGLVDPLVSRYIHHYGLYKEGQA